MRLDVGAESVGVVGRNMGEVMRIIERRPPEKGQSSMYRTW